MLTHFFEATRRVCLVRDKSHHNLYLTMSTMKKITLPLWSCVLTAALCCNSYNQLLAQQTRASLSVKDKVRECVFRYQISNFGVTDQEYNKHFFVGNSYVARDDPSPGVIANLQSRAYSVKGISQCTQSPKGVFDLKTKVRGLAFIVSSMKFISGEHAQVNADFFRDGKGGNEAIYTVKIIKGSWKITKCKIMALN